VGNRISIDTGDVTDSPVYEFGTLHIDIPDDKVMEYMHAFSMLGFVPRHEVTDE